MSRRTLLPRRGLSASGWACMSGRSSTRNSRGADGWMVAIRRGRGDLDRAVHLSCRPEGLLGVADAGGRGGAGRAEGGRAVPVADAFGCYWRVSGGAVRDAWRTGQDLPASDRDDAGGLLGVGPRRVELRISR